MTVERVGRSSWKVGEERRKRLEWRIRPTMRVGRSVASDRWRTDFLY